MKEYNKGTEIDMIKFIEILNEDKCESVILNNSLIEFGNEKKFVYTKSMKLFVIEEEFKSIKYHSSTDIISNELIKFLTQSKLSNIELQSNKNIVLAVKGMFIFI